MSGIFLYNDYRGTLCLARRSATCEERRALLAYLNYDETMRNSARFYVASRHARHWYYCGIYKSVVLVIFLGQRNKEEIE